jgi:cell division protein FtsN
MMRSLALLLVALPAVALGQQADSSARLTLSSRRTGAIDSTMRPDSASIAEGATSAAVDSIFLRAQQMVANGQGDAGRALVQAQLDSAPIGSPRYVTALYWRAVVAETAAGAERDLRRIVIEFPLSPESGDALMRLAQLEMARGDRQQALEHLDRLLLEHPNNPSRGRAAFWMGQLLLENGQTAAACARLAQASAATPAGEVELHNQIAYYQQRCVGVDTSAASGTDTMRRVPPTPDSVPAPTPTVPSPSRVPASAPSSRPAAATAEPPVHRVATNSTPMYASGSSAVASQSATPTQATTAQPAAARPAAAHPAALRATTAQPATAHGAAAQPAPAHVTASHPAPSGASRSATAGRYTIQIAAFTSRDAAERLSEGLVSRGYDARVVASGKYYRVRIGRYATRHEAVGAAKALRARHIDGMVTDAEP